MKLLRTILVAAVSTGLVALGCSSSSLSFDDQPPGPPTGKDITFANTVEAIVQEKCQNCHREGGAAPFSLASYEDVKRVGGIARNKVQSREMPPWGAFDDEACKVRHKFKDDLRLSDEQVNQFVTWIDNGMPLGDPAARPPAKTQFAATALVDRTSSFPLPKPFEVVGGGADDIRCFPIDPGFKADTWIGASNVVPGDPRVVHHVIVYVDPEREGITKVDGTGSYKCFGGPEVSNPSLLLAWAPGVPPAIYPESTGLKVPANAHLVMQVHYHPTATTVTDNTAFELKALEFKPAWVTQIILLGNAESANGPIKLLPGPNDPATGPAFFIPANAKGHTESMEVVIPEKIDDFEIPQLSIASVGSHMHWAGVDLKIDIERSGRVPSQPAKECLLGTPKYDFNWQRAYQYDAPLEELPLVGPGDKLRFTCTYDNTMDNKHVRNAVTDARMSGPTDVRLGETTFDEMCLGAIVIVRRATLVD